METLALCVFIAGVGMVGIGIGSVLLVTAYSLLLDARASIRAHRRSH